MGGRSWLRAKAGLGQWRAAPAARAPRTRATITIQRQAPPKPRAARRRRTQRWRTKISGSRWNQAPTAHQPMR
eukprot:1480998-Alexandrium_andersonii.AAC.1